MIIISDIILIFIVSTDIAAVAATDAIFAVVVVADVSPRPYASHVALHG